MQSTGFLIVNATQDVNLAHVVYSEITWTGGVATNVRLHFTDTWYIDLTGEDAKNYISLRLMMPKLKDAKK